MSKKRDEIRYAQILTKMKGEKILSEEDGQNMSKEVWRWKLERKSLNVKMRRKNVIYSVWKVGIGGVQ